MALGLVAVARPLRASIRFLKLSYPKAGIAQAVFGWDFSKPTGDDSFQELLCVGPISNAAAPFNAKMGPNMRFAGIRGLERLRRQYVSWATRGDVAHWSLRTVRAHYLVVSSMEFPT